MAGLIEAGAQTRQRAIGGLESASQMQSQREQAGEAIKTAEQGQKASMVGTGAGAGAAITLAAGGPVGWGIAAGIGAGYLLSEIF